MKANKVMIFSAPSGSGKTTIVRHLLQKFPQLEFSVSATSRPMRSGEIEGKDYYFIALDEFRKRAANDEFVEFEEVYAGRLYGTLKTEAQRIWNAGKIIVFDVDVKGGMRLKKIYGNSAQAIFIMPPSLDELRQRLKKRGTESDEEINKRVQRADEEISYAKKFDQIIINDNLDEALLKAEKAVEKWINE